MVYLQEELTVVDAENVRLGSVADGAAKSRLVTRHHLLAKPSI